jgi:N-acetylmuramoyl-L-alanine amidase
MICFDSPNKRERKGPISIIVIHYTEIDFETTKKIFLDETKQVSAHLVIDQDGTVYRFVEDEDVAYHAGDSYWQGLEGINEYSIGIELVHPGFSQAKGIKVIGDPHLWTSYDGRQIDALIQICKDYSAQYNILPKNIVGHSDVAPWRYNNDGQAYAAKQDPGPLFPWRHLHNQGVGLWYRPESVFTVKPFLLDPEIDQDNTYLYRNLTQLGYRATHDPKTIKLALRAFQMHYRPSDITGRPDQETLSIMAAILSAETSQTSPG